MPQSVEPLSKINPVAVAVGLPDAPVLTTRRVAAGTGISFLELNSTRRNSGVTPPFSDDAFLLALQLRKSTDFDLFVDGKFVRPQGFGAGEIAIFDLRTHLVTDQRDPFHALDFYLPRSALTAMGESGDLPRHIQELRHAPGVTIWDPVVRDLLLSMRPALAARPEETAALFIDYVALALAIHVARSYGAGGDASLWEGGLAPWQERRAKELVEANLGGGVTLSDLAQACELSTRHFTRAFRQSTGMAPHQWLQQRRLAKAKQLLEFSAAPLNLVALDCGFADQSHFTRVFSRATGFPPGIWRRMKCR